MGNTFSKEERLAGKSRIDRLFRTGSSFVVYPYRVVFLSTEKTFPSDFPAQALVSVPKRRFKRAVDRNLLKRRMREVYRLQKADLYAFLREHSLRLHIAFQYVGKEELPFAYLHERMGSALSKIRDESTKYLLGKSD